MTLSKKKPPSKNANFSLQVNGYDRDLGFNGDLLYVISNGDFDSVFKIDTLTGELFVDAQLDRETTTNSLPVNVSILNTESKSPLDMT